MAENATLLIVDDSRISRMMISKLVKIREPDWKLIEAANGEEALKKADELDIDYCSVDLSMPGMDGYEVIRQIKSRQPLSRIVLMTANIQSNVLKQVADLGAACVHKPVTEASIDKMLEYFHA